MKRLVFVALLGIATTATAGAQDDKMKQKMKDPMSTMDHAKMDHAKMGAEGWNEHLAEHFKGVTLSADQKNRIIAANKQHHDAIAALEKAGKKDDPATKAAIQKHMDAEHADFKQILTAEQYKAFTENMAKMEGGMGKMKGDMKGMEHDMSAMKHDMKDMKDAKKPDAPKKP